MSEYRCGGCDSHFGGLRTAHCGACHRTFTGITTFDKHRVRHKCIDPATVGLVDAGRKYPCFGTEGDGDDWFATLKD